MAKSRSGAADSKHGTIVIRRDHAWEFCCGTFWTTTCHEMQEGENMAHWTGRLDGPSEASFPGGQPFPAGTRTIRCGKCNEPLLGLQRIRAAERMIGDLVGDPGFKVWPVKPGPASFIESPPYACERCGKSVASDGSNYCFSFDIWKGNSSRNHAGGATALDEDGRLVIVFSEDRPGCLCNECEALVSIDLGELAKKHKLNAIVEGKIVSRSLHNKSSESGESNDVPTKQTKEKRD